MQATLRLLALFGGLIAIFVVIGWVLGTLFFGDWILGSLIFLILAGVINFVSYFFSHKIVLWSYRAKIATKQEQPRLYNIVNKVCIKANMPMPQIAMVPVQTPNAFATGRNEKTAVVAATEGLMSLLTDDELEGVLAHEMAHIKDKDMLVMTVAATVAGAISFAARMALWSSIGGRRGGGNGNAILLLVVAITAPIAALLLRLAISRSREYKADKEGALMIQRPLALARALEKLEEGNRRRPMTTGNPTTSSLFIVNPFRGGGFVTIFMTHPPIASRVRRLEDLADKTGFIA
ncbi:MAG: zinc metalloprotease HtpX [Candidatus Thermoplasmatota archaeon]|nr:zinc metalloprotease HtpX [Candidatus Thermoplasmatota archaeon]